MYKNLFITALLILLTACANKQYKIDQFPLGTQENPVRVGGPAGQRDYLSRLVCDNNEQVSAYVRLGSSDIGPYGNIIDIYEVICDTDKGVVTHDVFLDMYHYDYVEIRPAAGFIALKPSNKLSLSAK